MASDSAATSEAPRRFLWLLRMPTEALASPPTRPSESAPPEPKSSEIALPPEPAAPEPAALEAAALEAPLSACRRSSTFG